MLVSPQVKGFHIAVMLSHSNLIKKRHKIDSHSANAILLLILVLYARSSKDISLPETTTAQSLAGPVQSQSDP
jgi:Mg2+/citrate symporter